MCRHTKDEGIAAMLNDQITTSISGRVHCNIASIVQLFKILNMFSYNFSTDEQVCKLIVESICDLVTMRLV
jgi:hypothetical protein